MFWRGLLRPPGEALAGCAALALLFGVVALAWALLSR
jgi:hypothetical protein